MAHEELTELTPVLRSQSTEKPGIPIPIFLGECKVVDAATPEDEEALVKARLAEALLRAFPKEMRALESAELLWQAARFNAADMPLLWRKESPKAWKLRQKLITAFRHYYLDEPALLRRIDVIAEGDTNDDMLFNLLALAELGEANRGSLENTDFDMALLAEARRMGTELSAIYAEKRVETEADSPEYILRNQAFHQCKGTLDKIRETGCYIHPLGTPRHNLYISQYMKKKNTKKRSSGNSGSAS